MEEIKKFWKISGKQYSLITTIIYNESQEDVLKFINKQLDLVQNVKDSYKKKLANDLVYNFRCYIENEPNAKINKIFLVSCDDIVDFKLTKNQKREAEDILSQEYIIALQPSPLFQLWTLKRLIMVWYGDPIIEPHIRKIKVLINQYRSDPNQEYNKMNGMLGSILIYPKYGVESAKIVLSKIDYYFSLYVDENTNPRYQDIQWSNSTPSYFIKKNSLLYYTNGSIDLKNYIKSSLASNTMLSNSTLTKDYVEFLDSKKVMGV